MAYRITFVEPIHCDKCNRDLRSGALARIVDGATVEHDCGADELPSPVIVAVHLAVVKVGNE